uniref:Phosphatidylinositide phosphatase SAC2 n=1 Tax=Schistosoma haematobium TaxID=6185 RepID=A0A094ZQ34_SCHHA
MKTYACKNGNVVDNNPQKVYSINHLMNYLFLNAMSNPSSTKRQAQTENQEAFNKYWSRHFQEFERILIVNLLSSGRKHRETILTDAFLRHILLSKNEQLAYIGFDFHDFWLVLQISNNDS